MKSNQRIIFLILLSFSFSFTQMNAWVDLEEKPQSFILETKQIEIPGYPDAFNPSIIRWNGILLLSFRSRDPITQSATKVLFVWLNDDFELVTEPQEIMLSSLGPDVVSWPQDPRLIVKNDKLYMIYNNVVNNQNLLRRMCCTEIVFENAKFIAKGNVCFREFEGEIKQKHEKNWTPFVFNNELLISYSINPHLVFQPNLENEQCETIAKTQSLIHWNWGILRGGTQAFLIDGEYLSFFHSSKDMVTKHSNGTRIVHYFMGAYTFSGQPPFKIKKISKKPIVAKGFYEGPEYKLWKPLKVVFPSGYVFDDQYIWLVYGKQDHELWLAKLDKKSLLNSLISIN